MSNYRQITIQILDLCREGRELVHTFDQLNKRLDGEKSTEERDALIANASSTAALWCKKCQHLLNDSGLEIELVQFLQTSASPIALVGYNRKLSGVKSVTA